MTGIDRTAGFLSMVENNKAILYKVAQSYCRNPEDRNDLVQEIILQLWKSYDNYNEKYAHTTWIYRISLNVAISFYRKEYSRQRISNPITAEIFEFSDVPFQDNKESELAMLNQFISRLGDLDKALILLYLEEKSYKEISEIIGITETNISTKIGRIKNKLRQEFNHLNNT